MADRAVVSEELADALEQVIRRTGPEPRGSRPGQPAARSRATNPAARSDRDDLVDAYHEVLADGVRARLPEAPPRPARRWPWVLGAAVLLAGAAFWIRQSGEIARASAPIVVSPEERQQELELITVANRVARYVRDEGSLPSVLQAARVEVKGVAYEIRGPRAFALSSARQGRSLRVTVQVPESGPVVFAFIRPTR